jgi:HK97 family phage prohead protease
VDRLSNPTPPPPFKWRDEPGLLRCVIAGCAAPTGEFQKLSDGTVRHYLPGCFDDTIAGVASGEQVVELWFRHSPEYGVLATTAGGTLCLSTGPEGLCFRARLRDDETGRQIVRRLLDGWLGCSCGYCAPEEQCLDGRHFGLIDGFLTEISLTPDPAFCETSVRVEPLAGVSRNLLRQAIFGY